MAYISPRLFLCTTLLLLPMYVNGQTDIKENLLVDSAGSWTKNNTDLAASDTHNCKSQYSCNGCHQVRICSTCPGGKYHQVSLVNCTGLTPYCKEDSGTCTAFLPERCAPVSENFMCMRESGSYPDPANCTRYHICKNHTAYTFSCYGGTVFNSRTGECERTDCYKFNCANKNGLKVPYGNNKNVYAYCVHGLLWFIDRCPLNYELNEVTQQCEPVCKMEGFVADSSNSSRYFVCAKGPGRSTLSAQKRVCPNGSMFNRDYVHCVTLLV